MQQLADRFVRGTCPKCKSKDQPGDNCSVCGHHYSPVELIDPVSTLSGAKPEVRSCPHLFIELEQLHDFLGNWATSGDHLQSEVLNYLKGHFLHEPLRDAVRQATDHFRRRVAPRAVLRL